MRRPPSPSRFGPTPSAGRHRRLHALIGALMTVPMVVPAPLWAQDATIEPAPDATIEPAPDANVEAAPQDTNATETTPDDDGVAKRWGLAPIRWGGTVSLGFRQRDSDTAGQSSERQLETRLRASSYLVQPWIARIGADLSLTFIDADNEGNNNLAASSITGTTTLNVFPLSRFPFQASLSLSDSRTDGAVADTDYRRTRLSLRQEYRPPRDSWSSFAQYDLSRLTGSFGDDTVNRLAGGLKLTRERHTLNLDGSYARNDRADDGSVTDRVASARHGFRASDALMIETLATYSDSNFDNAGVAGFTGSNQTLQAYSFANWTPINSPWRATASVRYLGSQNSGAGTDLTLRSIGATGSLNYQANRNLGFFGSLTLTRSETGKADSLTSAQTLGANYSADPLTFGNYSYNWYGSGSVSNVSTDDDNQRSTSVAAGHSLNRSWVMSEISTLSLTATQGLTTVHASGIDAISTNTLNHSVGLAWRTAPAEGLLTYVSANVSDSRTRGDADSDFRLYNLQANGSWRLSPRAELTANLTWQRTTQRRETASTSAGSQAFDRPTDTNVSANITYNHSAIFGVRNLRYALRFTANTFQTDSRLSGNPDASRERVTRDLDQRLRYRIGRMHGELQLRVATVDGKENALLFFKLSRDFGSF